MRKAELISGRTGRASELKHRAAAFELASSPEAGSIGCTWSRFRHRLAAALDQVPALIERRQVGRPPDM